MKENACVSKSFEFAVRIVNLYKYLSAEHKEYVLSKQLLRCGTSINHDVDELISILTAICKYALK